MKEPLAAPNSSDAETSGKCYIDPDSTQTFIETLIKLKEQSETATADTEKPCEPDQ